MKPTEAGYWWSEEDHPVADWQYAVANDDTRLGYWEWLAIQREADEVYRNATEGKA
jgi:hypothetical protein